MQPMLRQVPPKVPRLSMQAAVKPSCPARMAPLYPPAPPPITTTSNESAIVRIQLQCNTSPLRGGRNLQCKFRVGEIVESQMPPPDNPSLFMRYTLSACYP